VAQKYLADAHVGGADGGIGSLSKVCRDDMAHKNTLS
jgi:hypothetical protein